MRGERKKNKRKVVQIFLRCFDGWSSIALEVKLVYSTKATSRYQERKDSVLHALRGRGFSYSGSFSVKGWFWVETGRKCMLDSVVLVFGPCMMGFEVGFDSGAAVQNW